jgi:predicted nucleic acid-binding protein
LSAFTSELTLAELLVKPIRDGDTRAKEAVNNLIGRNARLVAIPVNRPILVLAAEIRATSSMRLPDAIHLVTARLTSCDFLLTNDQAFKSAIQPPRVYLLSELMSSLQTDHGKQS